MTLEKILYIDFYHPISEDEGIIFNRFDHLYKMDVKTSTNIGEVIEELKIQIFNHYGDGLFIQAEEFQHFCYLNIMVLFGSEYDFLVDYIKDVSKPYVGPHPEAEQPEDIALSVDYLFSQVEAEELQDELNKLGVTSEIYFIKRKAFERGSGDYHENVILSLISGSVHAISSKLTGHLINKFKKHQNLKIYNISSEEILSYIAEETGISKQHLYVTEKRSIGEDKIEFSIVNRYKVITAIYNKSLKEVDYKVQDKAQTMI